MVNIQALISAAVQARREDREKREAGIEWVDPVPGFKCFPYDVIPRSIVLRYGRYVDKDTGEVIGMAEEVVDRESDG